MPLTTTVIFLVGTAVYISAYEGLTMLSLSIRYSTAGQTDRPALLAAGQAVLAAGANHSLATLPGFFFTEVGGVLMAVALHRARVVSRATGLLGIVGFGCLAAYEVVGVILVGPFGPALVLAVAGGLTAIAWNIAVAVGMFKFAGAESRRGI